MSCWMDTFIKSTEISCVCLPNFAYGFSCFDNFGEKKLHSFCFQDPRRTPAELRSLEAWHEGWCLTWSLMHHFDRCWWSFLNFPTCSMYEVDFHVIFLTPSWVVSFVSCFFPNLPASLVFGTFQYIPPNTGGAAPGVYGWKNICHFA